MSTLLKNQAMWLVATIGVFATIYVIGSFCVMSLDITTWTSGWGRLGLVFLSSCIGGGMIEAINDAERRRSMSPAEREKAEAEHQARHSHADY